jgi:uncharacterized membrane protein YecN with MAPEG domain
MEIVGLYAGLLGLIYITLSYRVVKLRRIHQVGIGDGGVSDLQKTIRAHANFMEYVPICLVLLTLLAASNVSHLIVHVAGAALVIARSLHAIGLTSDSGKSFGRFWGTLVTWLLLLGMSLVNVVLFLL